MNLFKPSRSISVTRARVGSTLLMIVCRQSPRRPRIYLSGWSWIELLFVWLSLSLFTNLSIYLSIYNRPGADKGLVIYSGIATAQGAMPVFSQKYSVNLGHYHIMSLNWVLLPNSESDRRNGVTSSGSERSTPPSSSAQSRLNLEGLPEGWTMQVSNERMYRNFPIWILLSVWPDGLHYFRNICPFTAIKICPIVVFLPKWVHKFVIYNFFVIVANFCHMWSHWFPGGRTYRNKRGTSAKSSSSNLSKCCFLLRNIFLSNHGWYSLFASISCVD